MQTFLPYPEFYKSAKVLDRLRLNKQRVEVKQIYLALQPDSTSAWRNHPAVLMWKGYEIALLAYGVAICEEHRARGYNDTLLPYFEEEIKKLYEVGIKAEMPPWLGKSEFHSAHRSNLLRKSEYYEKFGWIEDKDQPYLWPTKEGLM
jgi:hypothetical protein